tara:strand:+ start:981 stop:1136 length:156 start_codon:yes stop_codon:yes gene_type:complete
MIYRNIYRNIGEAIKAAKEMCVDLDTYVKITECEDGYELFGTGKLIMEIKE